MVHPSEKVASRIVKVSDDFCWQMAFNDIPAMTTSLYQQGMNENQSLKNCDQLHQKERIKCRTNLVILFVYASHPDHLNMYLMILIELKTPPEVW